MKLFFSFKWWFAAMLTLALLAELEEQQKNEMLCLCFNRFRQELTTELNHLLEQHPVGSAFRLEGSAHHRGDRAGGAVCGALHINYEKIAGLFGDRVPFALRTALALGGAMAEPVLLPMLLTPERKEQLRGMPEGTLNKQGLRVEVAAVEAGTAARQPQPAHEESEEAALRLPPQPENALLDALVRYLQKREQPQPAKLMATLRRDWFKLFDERIDAKKVAEIRFCEMDEDTPACAIDLSEEQNGGCMGWASKQEGDNYILTIACENGRVYAPQDSSNLFAFFSCAEKIDVSRLDTSKVTNMSGMFFECFALENLDVSGWDTSKVTNMSGMFVDCNALENLDVSRWNTSKVTDMSWMFTDCHVLESPDVSRWNTSKVTDMSRMFAYCYYALESLDVSGWDTSKVTDMEGMFTYCYALKNLDVSRWNTSKVTNMRWMFSSCYALQSLDVSGWDTSRVKDMAEMFKGCPAPRPAWHHELSRSGGGLRWLMEKARQPSQNREKK